MSDRHASEDQLLELALEQTSDTHAALLQRVAACTWCHDAYDDVCRVVDATLAASPAIAPPAGFETRVLDRLAGETGRAARSVRRTSLLVAASVAGLLVGGTVVNAMHEDDPAPEAAYTSGGHRLLTADGDDVGAVLPSRYAGRDVLVIVVEEGSPGTEYVCRLRLADGTTRDAGRWTVPPSGRAVWVTPLSTSATEAGQVELRRYRQRPGVGDVRPDG